MILVFHNLIDALESCLGYDRGVYESSRKYSIIF